MANAVRAAMFTRNWFVETEGKYLRFYTSMPTMKPLLAIVFVLVKGELKMVSRGLEYPFYPRSSIFRPNCQQYRTSNSSPHMASFWRAAQYAGFDDILPKRMIVVNNYRKIGMSMAAAEQALKDRIYSK